MRHHAHLMPCLEQTGHHAWAHQAHADESDLHYVISSSPGRTLAHTPCQDCMVTFCIEVWERAMSQRLNYIGGEWVSGKAVIHDMNPSDLKDEVGQYAAADAAQTAHAIAAAKTAFAQRGKASGRRNRRGGAGRLYLQVFCRRSPAHRRQYRGLGARRC